MIWTGKKLESIQEFVEKVEKMRQLQRAYFKSRDKDILIACKEKEREVDEFIRLNGPWS